ncbi:hypothetical protein DXT63_15755 [Thermoanaerobacteraceae bacterium SP2]|nr:hypothetical protein DXT63_15755 [Thermoanaerobacteraceae bacterium SP2]
MNDEIDKRSIGYKRRLSSLNKETDAMIYLLKQALENGVPAKPATGLPLSTKRKSKLGQRKSRRTSTAPYKVYNI